MLVSFKSSKRLEYILTSGADTEGKTSLAYSPDGKYLLTVGENNYVRRYEVGSTDEPSNIDNIQRNNTGIAVSKNIIAICAEDGTVSSYGLESLELNGFLTRCSLPAREIAMSPDGMWLAVASDELIVKVVNTLDMHQVLTLRGMEKPAKHVSFHPSGSYLAVSSTDGTIYIYSLTSEEPAIVKKLDGYIQALETDSEFSSKVAWHPDGRTLAVPTATRDIVMISRDNWEKQRTFSDAHVRGILDFAWSPNGALLATAAQDGKLIIWETKTQTIVHKYDYNNISQLVWHPKENILSFTTNQGHLYQLPEAVPASHAALLKGPARPAPLLDAAGNVRESVVDNRRRRSPTRDSFDSLINSPRQDVEDDFIVDDDGMGYAEPKLNGFGKRGIEHLGLYDRPGVKRLAPGLWQPMIHDPFQPGSTKWKGNRRYLCVNLVGIVWTVNQETHNTVTVEFYDREQFRDFHYTDDKKFDKACLNEHGTLFSNSPRPKEGQPSAVIYYRPHETWTGRNNDWTVKLPEEEEVTCKSENRGCTAIDTDFNSNGSEQLLHRSLYVKRLCSCLHTIWHTVQGIPPEAPPGRHLRLVARLHLCRRQRSCWPRWSRSAHLHYRERQAGRDDTEQRRDSDSKRHKVEINLLFRCWRSMHLRYIRRAVGAPSLETTGTGEMGATS